VRAIAPDIIALGYDQKTYSTAKLKSALKSLGLTPEIIRLWAYEPRLYKSSLLRKKL
jgi:glycerol-3-phosphate cytidylyltransferase-like family protein